LYTNLEVRYARRKAARQVIWLKQPRPCFLERIRVDPEPLAVFERQEALGLTRVERKLSVSQQARCQQNIERRQQGVKRRQQSLERCQQGNEQRTLT
jgi:hypothetical protein